MADLALVTAGRCDPEESILQLTLPAAVDLLAGSCVRINTSGKFALADASAAGTADAYGVTVGHDTKAGMPVTAIRIGLVDGFDLSALNPGAKVYLSDTNTGILADAAGTVSVLAGMVVPVFGHEVGHGPDKLLQVQFTS